MKTFISFPFHKRWHNYYWLLVIIVFKIAKNQNTETKGRRDYRRRQFGIVMSLKWSFVTFLCSRCPWIISTSFSSSTCPKPKYYRDAERNQCELFQKLIVLKVKWTDTWENCMRAQTSWICWCRTQCGNMWANFKLLCRL